MFTATMLYIMVVVFLTTAVKSWLGFGQALMALPLLAMCMSIRQAAALVLLISLASSVVMLAHDWRHLHLGGMGWLLVGAAVGVPLGGWALNHIDERFLKGALALLLIAFSAYSLLGRLPPELKHDYPAGITAAGFVAGILGGAYGMNGPPLVIYGAMRRWGPQKFRTTLQGYFLLMAFMIMAVYSANRMWTAPVMRYFLFTLPAMVLAIWLGRAVSRRLEGPIFYKCVYSMLVLIGADLLRSAIFVHK